MAAIPNFAEQAEPPKLQIPDEGKAQAEQKKLESVIATADAELAKLRRQQEILMQPGLDPDTTKAFEATNAHLASAIEQLQAIRDESKADLDLLSLSFRSTRNVDGDQGAQINKHGAVQA